MPSIRQANKSDVPAIVDFLRAQWRTDHVFVQRPEILKWQHHGRDLALNFVLAEDDHDITALLGFIPFRRFDPALTSNTVGLAVWRAAEQAPPGVGILLLKHLIQIQQPTLLMGIGLSDMVIPVYRALGYRIGVMQHLALFNPEITKSRITGRAVVHDPPRLHDQAAIIEASWRDLQGYDIDIDRLGKSTAPDKSWRYVQTRFAEHPWYDYHPLLLGRPEQPQLLVIYRIVEVDGARLLRVVDALGPSERLPSATRALTGELQRHDAEYADLLVAGVDEATMLSNGWTSRTIDPGLPLTTRFNPFERVYTDTYYFTRSTSDDMPVRLHPADTDQDRPNL